MQHTQHRMQNTQFQHTELQDTDLENCGVQNYRFTEQRTSRITKLQTYRIIELKKKAERRKKMVVEIKVKESRTHKKT